MKKVALIAIFITMLLNSCALIEGKDENVIARVGREKITFEDISAYVEQYKAMYAQGNRPFGEKDSLELIKFILDNEITARVLLQEAKKDPELAVTDSALKVAKENFMARMGSAAAMLGEKERESLFKEMEDEIKKNIMLEGYMRKLSQSISPDSAEIAQYYSANKSEFMRYEVKHILIMINDTVNEEAARTKIGEIKNEIAAGKSFDDAAREHSNCPSSQRGGSLGSGSLRDWDPAFSGGVKALAKGEISNPVRSRFGYHLIKLMDILEAGELDATKANRIRSRIGNERVREHIENVKKNYKIEIFI